jgi:hypothetical protein
MNFESIHNYYEPLVIDEVMSTLVTRDQVKDPEFLQDVACLALNSLPARYVRHDVDMAFYLSTAQREQIRHDVTDAVTQAAERIRARNRDDNERTAQGPR